MEDEHARICYRCGDALEAVIIPITHESCEKDAAYQVAEKYWRQREGIGQFDDLSEHDKSEVARCVEHFRPIFRRNDELVAGLKRAVESMVHGELSGSIIKQANRVLRKGTTDEP